MAQVKQSDEFAVFSQGSEKFLLHRKSYIQILRCFTVLQTARCKKQDLRVS